MYWTFYSVVINKPGHCIIRKKDFHVLQTLKLIVSLQIDSLMDRVARWKGRKDLFPSAQENVFALEALWHRTSFTSFCPLFCKDSNSQIRCRIILNRWPDLCSDVRNLKWIFKKELFSLENIFKKKLLFNIQGWLFCWLNFFFSNFNTFLTLTLQILNYKKLGPGELWITIFFYPCYALQV